MPLLPPICSGRTLRESGCTYVYIVAARGAVLTFHFPRPTPPSFFLICICSLHYGSTLPNFEPRSTRPRGDDAGRSRERHGRTGA